MIFKNDLLVLFDFSAEKMKTIGSGEPELDQ